MTSGAEDGDLLFVSLLPELTTNCLPFHQEMKGDEEGVGFALFFQDFVNKMSIFMHLRI